ncbi:hypothetical protein EDC96DRAFT_202667 [Choanephora cucurbitarum]|nr:hypothetical protein EDC96DRAFT_202667 [Choanephora cucurbitarum]
MAFERISQILPTVKCSDCGRDVEIRRLGEHICSSQPPVPSIPIIPTLKDKNKLYHPVDGLISPLQSPKYNAPKKADFYQPPAGSVTPPYQSGRDLQRPLNNYTDDSYSDDFYKQPFTQKSTTSLPRKNSNTPVSTSPTSFR